MGFYVKAAFNITKLLPTLKPGMVKDAGIPGYTEDQWTKSETVQFIERNALPFKKNYTVYSDAYDAIYWFTGRPENFFRPGNINPQ